MRDATPYLIILAVIVVAVWLSRMRAEAPLADRGVAPSRPRTLTRRYRGSPQEAAEAFQRDAAILERQGYMPVSQIYTPGTYGCAAFLLALILFLVLIGILIFIYMLIVKPPGTLLVTYELRERAPVPPPVDEPAAALSRLATMRNSGLITDEEYAAKRAEILARL